MADFPAYCGRCGDLTPHDDVAPPPAPPACMRCTHGPSFRESYGPVSAAARKRLMQVPPSMARGVRVAKQEQDGPGGILALLCILLGAGILFALFALR